MSKILSPKAWYLVAVGAVALTADGVRRLVKRRRAADHAGEAEVETVIPMMSFEPTKAAPVKETRAAPKPTAKTAPVQMESTPVAVLTPQPAAADDLTEINGIGPTFAKRLAEAGITTFADIAASSPEHLREVTHATAIANPDEWIAQARLR